MTESNEKRLLRVIRYIHDNPGGDLSLDALADVAAMSRYHWHRVFAATTGETLASAARRIRLSRAATWLVETDRPIATIAAEVGYARAQSFARAFRETYGLSPGAFRAAGQRPIEPGFRTRRKGTTMFSVKIEDRPARRAAAMPHKGPYPTIGRAFEQLSAIFTTRDLWAASRGMMAVYYDDPWAVAAAELRSHAGAFVSEEFEIPDPLEDVRTAAGPTAVLRLKGPYTGLPAAYDHLFGTWLAEAGREAADHPSYETYLNSPLDTPPEALLTEICLPLKPA
ncbi:MAG: AraC family transcriptional regulator [Pseudomonadota bacterium]